jgi:molybdate transport system substrate-binding protein
MKILGRALLAGGGLLLAAAASWSADLRVLTAGALKSLALAQASSFEQQTGQRLLVESDTAGALLRRVQAGEAFDAIIVTRAGIEQLIQAGKVDAASALPLARIGIGVAAPQGARRPDIGTVAGFRQALLDAPRVAYVDPAAGGSSGIYLSQLFQRMGIGEDMARKAVLVPGGLVAQRLVSGEADLALQQMTELLAVPGVMVLGPIPSELQNFTVYVGAVSVSASDASAAKTFLGLLVRAAAQATDKGMQAP